MDSRKQKYMIIGALCLVVVGLSIGYAALSASLKIAGTATVPAEKWSVIFVKENSTTTKTGQATCVIGNVTGTSITGLSASFKVPGDSCTFTVPVENAGTIAAKLTDVTGKDSPLTFTGTGASEEADETLLKGNVEYKVSYGTSEINGSTEFNNIPILDSKEKTTITLKISFKTEATDIPKEAVTIGGLDRTFIFENAVNGDGSSGTVTPVVETKPNAPKLSDGMIPVYYKQETTTTGSWVKADDTNKDNNWYDYDHQKWANAVTVSTEKREQLKSAPEGTPIEMSDINTMWVWIPRYSYTIQGTYGRGGTSAALPGAIDIKFLSESAPAEDGTASYIGSEQNNWRTPDAFKFGGTTQAGIWVGKFETTGTLASPCTNENCTVSTLSIKPDTPSLRSQVVSSFFYAARSMQNDTTTFGFTSSGDLHMMKNGEWGAVAYLSQSKYGKHGNTDYTGKYEEIYQNKSSTYITGNSNGTPSQESTNTQYAYNNMTELGDGQGQAGPGASTTGNIYGIYDMSGGAWEYVMGVLAYYEDNSPMSGNSTTYNSGFTGKVWQSGTYADYQNNTTPLAFPDEKYYNLYKVATTAEGMPTSSNLTYSQKACDGGICYGQALSETSGWYGDYAGFVYREYPWSVRGGYYSNTTAAGVFYSSNASGSASGAYGSRFVFAP